MIVCCPKCNEVFEITPPTEAVISKRQAHEIIQLCADHFGVPYNLIISKYRGDLATKARHLAMFFIYGEERNGISLKDTGDYFNRDHTTVMNGIQRVKDSIDTKMDVFKDLMKLSPEVDGIMSDNPLKVAI